jgi:DNA repair protein RadD
MLQPRFYQQDAHDAVITHWRASTLPVVVEAATGAGKSVIVAMLAKTLHDLSGGKRVLCLAPSAILTEQNHEKYLAIGEKASIYSASISKSLRHQVIFATPLTFKKVARRLGGEFAGVIVDECHGITDSIKQIIEDMRQSAPTLRVCGLSATPYRLQTGFIFGVDPDGKALNESVARDPYFHQCVYSIGARMLLDLGFLTPLRAGEINASKYETDGLKVQSNGQFSAATVKAAFEGWGRRTAAIVADVVAQTQDATGVMLFAATRQHAREIMASLHPDNSALIDGETPKGERERIVKNFKAGKFLYLVSVGTLTTGFDAPNVSHIAILRATESVSLLQQIMGRGMRLFDGKTECVVFDYAGNFEKHCPDGDLYAPQVKAAYQSEGGDPIEAVCESCSRVNMFSARPNDSGFLIDVNGYFADLTGERIVTQNHKGEEVPMPAHFGRRCQHSHLRTGERCDYYWSCKVCPVCDHANDIAARFCSGCKSELINPNDKLIEMHQAHKKDPTKPQTEEVLLITYARGVSRSGNDMITAEVTTPRRKFPIYLLENSTWTAQKRMAFSLATDEFTVQPRTITYVKKGDFWEALGFGAPTDDEQLQQRLTA